MGRVVEELSLVEAFRMLSTNRVSRNEQLSYHAEAARLSPVKPTR